MKAVQKHATRGDPQSVISAIDYYCRHREWAMNIGDEKGQSTAFVFQTCQKNKKTNKTKQNKLLIKNVQGKI